MVVLSSNAELFYPGAPAVLLKSVASRLLNEQDSPKNLLMETALKTSELAEAAPKGSLQRRVLNATLVQFPSHIQTALKKKGRFFPSQNQRLRACKDVKTMADGRQLLRTFKSRRCVPEMYIFLKKRW
jgi:hypothetical protein